MAGKKPSTSASYKDETIIDLSEMHRIFQTCTVFPKTESLKQDAPAKRYKYSCSPEGCNFSQIISDLSVDPDFCAFGLDKHLVRFVQDIEKHPDFYKPAIYDGFQVNREGRDLFRLEREGATGSSRTGFLEYNVFRQELLEAKQVRRIEIAAQHGADTLAAAVVTALQQQQQQQQRTCAIM